MTERAEEDGESACSLFYLVPKEARWRGLIIQHVEIRTPYRFRAVQSERGWRATLGAMEGGRKHPPFLSKHANSTWVAEVAQLQIQFRWNINQGVCQQYSPCHPLKLDGDNVQK